MKRHVLPLLVALNLVLAALLAWLWLTPQGQLRDLRWEPPQPVRPALPEVPRMPSLEVDLARYVAMLERPLFDPTRRPPPPAAAAAAPAPDPMPDIHLLGVYGSTAAGGVIARVDGQVRRVRVGEAIGGWSIRELRGNEIVIGRGDDVRTIPLTRSSGAAPALAATPPAAGASAAPAGPAPPPAAQAARQRTLELARQRVRAMNALRARSGLPPLPEP